MKDSFGSMTKKEQEEFISEIIKKIASEPYGIWEWYLNSISEIWSNIREGKKYDDIVVVFLTNGMESAHLYYDLQEDCLTRFIYSVDGSCEEEYTGLAHKCHEIYELGDNENASGEIFLLSWEMRFETILYMFSFSKYIGNNYQYYYFHNYTGEKDEFGWLFSHNNLFHWDYNECGINEGKDTEIIMYANSEGVLFSAENDLGGETDIVSFFVRYDELKSVNMEIAKKLYMKFLDGIPSGIETGGSLEKLKELLEDSQNIKMIIDDNSYISYSLMAIKKIKCIDYFYAITLIEYLILFSGDIYKKSEWKEIIDILDIGNSSNINVISHNKVVLCYLLKNISTDTYEKELMLLIVGLLGQVKSKSELFFLKIINDREMDYIKILKRIYSKILKQDVQAAQIVLSLLSPKLQACMKIKYSVVD